MSSCCTAHDYVDAMTMGSSCQIRYICFYQPHTNSPSPLLIFKCCLFVAWWFACIIAYSLSDLFVSLKAHPVYILTAFIWATLNGHICCYPRSQCLSFLFHVNSPSQMGYPKLDNPSICQHCAPNMEFSLLVNSTTINAVNKIGWTVFFSG